MAAFVLAFTMLWAHPVKKESLRFFSSTKSGGKKGWRRSLEKVRKASAFILRHSRLVFKLFLLLLQWFRCICSKNEVSIFF